MDHFDPEPRRPPPRLSEYVLGTVLYAAILAVASVMRLTRRF